MATNFFNIDNDSEIPHNEKELDLRRKKFNFVNHTLVAMWIRHQYLKYAGSFLIIIIVIAWVVDRFQYEKRASHYLHDQREQFLCNTTSTYDWPVNEVNRCSDISSTNEYFLTNAHSKSLISVAVMHCELEGANFYYPHSFTSEYYNSYGFLVAFIKDTLFPLFITYLLVESLYLAMYDCLAIVPKGTVDTGVSLVYPWGGCWRVGFLVKWFPGSALLLPSGVIVLTFVTGAFVVIVSCVLLFNKHSEDEVIRCSYYSDKSINGGLGFLLGTLMIYMLPMIYIFVRHAIRVIFFKGNLENAVLNYKTEFMNRRLQNPRNPLNILAVVGFGVVILLSSPFYCMSKCRPSWESSFDSWLEYFLGIFAVKAERHDIDEVDLITDTMVEKRMQNV